MISNQQNTEASNNQPAEGKITLETFMLFPGNPSPQSILEQLPLSLGPVLLSSISIEKLQASDDAFKVSFDFQRHVNVPVFVLVSVTYDYFRFEELITANTSYSELHKKAEELGRKLEIPIFHYRIKDREDFEKLKFEFPEIKPNHLWICTFEEFIETHPKNTTHPKDTVCPESKF